MGGTKKKLREQATTSSGRAASEDRTRAVLLSDQLDQRRSALTGSVYGGGTEGAGFGAASTNPAIATPQRSGQQIHQWLLENPTPARGMDEEWNSYANTPEGREFLTLHATNREKAKASLFSANCFTRMVKGVSKAIKSNSEDPYKLMQLL